MYRWSAEARVLYELHALVAHHYPVMAADFTAAGRALLTAGLDGRACIWDASVRAKPKKKKKCIKGPYYPIKELNLKIISMPNFMRSRKVY